MFLQAFLQAFLQEQQLVRDGCCSWQSKGLGSVASGRTSILVMLIIGNLTCVTSVLCMVRAAVKEVGEG
jgi:hypothetical protein